MKIQEIKNEIKNKIAALATVNQKNLPHAIAVEINDIIYNKLIITDNYMKTTINNIKNNPNISIVFWDKNAGYRIDGKAEYHNSGKWLDFVKSLKENMRFPTKGALIINITEIKKIG